MRFSKEDKLIIEKNIQDVAKWLESNLKNVKDRIKINIPYKNNSVFFDVYNESDYCVRVGPSNLYFDTTRKIDTYSRYLGTDYEYAVVFIKNWKMIKQKILDEISKQEKDIESIYTFEV